MGNKHISLKKWCEQKDKYLLKEWDYQKNTIKPSDVGCKSHKRVFWICSKGHSWQSIISNRVRLHRGCPYCSNQKVLDGFNDLKTVDPNLAKEWDNKRNKIKPTEITIGSKKYAWWICSKGHSWNAQIKSRHNGVGCPYCANKKVLKGYNDLKTVKSNLVKEWDYEKNRIKPTEVTYGSGKKVWWICNNGHHYKATICNKVKGRGCPICNKSNRSSFPEQAVYFYIKKIFPDAINGYRDIFKSSMELDVYIPSLKIGIEYDGKAYHSKSDIEIRDQKKYLICKKHGIYLIRISEIKNRMNYLTNCDKSFDIPNASYEYLNIAINNVIYTIIKKNNYYKKRKDLIQKFIDDGEVDVKRDKNEILSLLEKKKTNLMDVFPEIAKEWDYDNNYPLIPQNFSPHSNERVYWICSKCGYKWITGIGSRTGDSRHHTGCPKCNKNKYKKVRCIETNKVYRSSNEIASEINGVPKMINEVCRGNKKSYKGFHFEYVD